MNLKSLLLILLVPSGILLIPAVAMMFRVEGWAWDAADFVIAWVIFAGAIAAYKFVARRGRNQAYRFATGIAVMTGILLLWVNAAVGLIGNEDNPANMMYGGVIVVGVIGVVMARLRPLGMARALSVTALAQFLVPVMAWIIWRPDFGPGVVQVFVLNCCFVVMFAASAFLFRHAGVNSGRASPSGSLPA